MAGNYDTSSLKNTTNLCPYRRPYETCSQSRHLVSSIKIHHHPVKCSIMLSISLVPESRHFTSTSRSITIYSDSLPGWMSFHCRRRWSIQPFLGRRSCYASASWRRLASPVVGPLSWPCAISWSKPVACVSNRARIAGEHGCASTQPIGHCSRRATNGWRKKKRKLEIHAKDGHREKKYVGKIMDNAGLQLPGHLLWHIKELIQIHTTEGEFTESTLLLLSFVYLLGATHSWQIVGLEVSRPHFINAFDALDFICTIPYSFGNMSRTQCRKCKKLM